MACMVESSKGVIYVSQDYGQNWQKKEQPVEWRDLIIVGNNTVPVIVLIDESGKLNAIEADGSSFQEIGETTFDTRPLGYGTSGMGVSLDGSTFSASFAEGGMV